MGTNVGTVVLAPGQSYIWYDNDGSFRPLANATMTPYTVTWLCQEARPYDYSVEKRKKGQKTPPKYQNEYGSWAGAPSTATITAQGCNNGQKTCIMRKSQRPKKKPPAYIHKAPKRHPNQKPPAIANDGYGKWTNDGGLTWSNDGGDPFADFGDEEFQSDQEDGTLSSEIENQ